MAALLGRADLPYALRPDALVLAGLPGRATDAVATWDDELDVRTSSPAHRGTLTQDPGVRRGALADAVPDAVPTTLDEGTVDVPVLLLVGDADPLADHEALERAAKSPSRARLSVVHGAHHDVLNDLQHRSVAAEVGTLALSVSPDTGCRSASTPAVVGTFLETLRNELRPLITVRASAW